MKQIYISPWLQIQRTSLPNVYVYGYQDNVTTMLQGFVENTWGPFY